MIEYGWAPGYGDGSPGWTPGYDAEAPGWGHPYVEEPATSWDSILRFGDEGGDVVTLRGAWANGPTMIKIIDGAEDVTEWPAVGGCWGGVPGYGDEIYPSRDGKRLRFVMPPLPLGVYSCKIIESTGVTTIDDFCEIVYRARPWPQGYDFARKVPMTWPVGARVPQMEPLASESNRPPYNGWQAVAKAIGRVFHEFAGAPCTRLREDLNIGASVALVETTLGFDDVRYIWADGVKIRVYGVDHTERELLLTGDDQTVLTCAITALTPVVLDAKSIRHPDFFEEPTV